MDAPELKPCPFCGERVEMNDYTDKPACAWVMIHRCKVLGPIKIEYGSGEKLAEVWNTRAEDHLMIEKDAEIKRLRAALGLYAKAGSWLLNGPCDPDGPNFIGLEHAEISLGGDNG